MSEIPLKKVLTEYENPREKSAEPEESGIKCSWCGEMFDPDNEGHCHNDGTDYIFAAEHLYSGPTADELKKLFEGKAFCDQLCEIGYLHYHYYGRRG